MNNSKCTLCIRREDKNKGEKRTPLIPSHAEYLKNEHGIEICVQPSKIRIFKDSDYRDHHIKLIEDLNQCSIIMALKEIPSELIMKDKTYIFFSHTIKGQPSNIPMLKRLKQLRCTLIDYEKITDTEGKRLIFFGIQAGQSGMIETLHALSQRLNSDAMENPFIELKQPYQYTSLNQGKQEIKSIGKRIKESGLSPDLTPFVCGFTGYGKTSQGAQEIFDILPYQEIKAKDLESFIKSKNYNPKILYKIVFKEEDIVEPLNNNRQFTLQDYYQHPENYQSKFSKYLPYLTLLINCIYWDPRYPKLVRNSDLKDLYKSKKNIPLKVIGDISCDIEGSIECTKFITTPKNPFFLLDPLSGKIKKDLRGRGVAVVTIDNLPAEIPLESSVFFSQTLKPFIPGIAEADFSDSFHRCQLPKPVKRAVILYNGEFTPDFKYMERFI